MHERQEPEDDPARIQDSNDAGPADCAAPSAPSSQPEPMIDPSEIIVRPRRPTSRFSSPWKTSIGRTSTSSGTLATALLLPLTPAAVLTAFYGHPRGNLSPRPVGIKTASGEALQLLLKVL